MLLTRWLSVWNCCSCSFDLVKREKLVAWFLTAWYCLAPNLNITFCAHQGCVGVVLGFFLPCCWYFVAKLTTFTTLAKPMIRSVCAKGENGLGSPRTVCRESHPLLSGKVICFFSSGEFVFTRSSWPEFLVCSESAKCQRINPCS